MVDVSVVVIGFFFFSVPWSDSLPMLQLRQPHLGGVGCCKGSVESLDAGGTRSGIGGGGGGFGGGGDC